MGVDSGSGGREFLWDVRELWNKGAGCLAILSLDVKVIRDDGRCAGGARDVRAKLWHCPGEWQVTSRRRGHT